MPNRQDAKVAMKARAEHEQNGVLISFAWRPWRLGGYQSESALHMHETKNILMIVPTALLEENLA